MKKLIKILPILMTVMMVFMAVSPVFASVGGVSISPDTQTAQGQLGNTPNRILGIIQVVGTVIAVGVLMVLGIKYMMGSAQEKAEYKKVFIPYIVGAGLLFAASVFADGIYQFFANMGK